MSPPMPKSNLRPWFKISISPRHRMKKQLDTFGDRGCLLSQEFFAQEVVIASQMFLLRKRSQCFFFSISKDNNPHSVWWAQTFLIITLATLNSFVSPNTKNKVDINDQFSKQQTFPLGASDFFQAKDYICQLRRIQQQHLWLYIPGYLHTLFPCDCACA